MPMSTRGPSGPLTGHLFPTASALRGTAAVTGHDDRSSSNPSAARKVSLSDIEEQLRSIKGAAKESIVGARAPVKTAALGTLLALVAASYLLGRRRGRRRASVLEIRRL